MNSVFYFPQERCVAAVHLRTVRSSTSILTALVLSAVLAVACGGGADDIAPAASAPPPVTPAPPVAPTNADITLLMMGNSHTSVNGLPETLATMIRTARPGKTVAAAVAPGSLFLEERVSHAPTLTLLRGHRWTFVILQAQKYSTSGQFSYSTTG